MELFIKTILENNENRILSEVIMDRDKLLTLLYNSRVMNKIRKEYRSTGNEIQNLRKKSMGLCKRNLYGFSR